MSSHCRPRSVWRRHSAYSPSKAWVTSAEYSNTVPGRLCQSGARIVFFFQAEDGIRDGRVTGVQTCALPISGILRAPDRVLGGCRRERAGCRSRDRFSRGGIELRVAYAAPDGLDPSASDPLDPGLALEVTRSEERRVGKECRSRWSR